MQRRRVVIVAALLVVALAAVGAVATSHDGLVVGSQHTTDTDFQNAQELTNLSVTGSGESASVMLSGGNIVTDDFEDGDLSEYSFSGTDTGDWGTTTTAINGSYSGVHSGDGNGNIEKAYYDGTSENLSISGWVSTPNLGGFVVGASSEGGGYEIYLTTNDEITINERSTGQTLASASVSIADDESYHLTLEYDRVSGEITAQVDNDADTSDTPLQSISTSSADSPDGDKFGLFAFDGNAGAYRWDNVQYTIGGGSPSSATYVSDTHEVTNAEEAAIHLTKAANVTVNATVRTESGAVLNQTTLTTAENHTLSLSSTSSERLETVLNVSVTGSNPALELSDESILFANHAPSVSLSDPDDGELLTDNTVTLNATVSDPEFGTAQGESVDAEFEVKPPGNSSYQTVDTVSASANGTVSTTYDASAGGQYEWRVTTTDSYGANTTSSIDTFSTPATLYIRNETNTSDLVTEQGNVTVRFFTEDEVVTRLTDDGTVPLTGLNVSAPFIVSADVGGYTQRVVHLDSIYEQEDIYLLNTSTASTIESRFVLDDPTGEFDSETLLKILKPVEQNGSTSYEIVYADRFGVEGVTAMLEEGQRYQIRIESSDGTTQVIGPYRGDVTEEVTVRPGTPTIDLGELEDGWGYNAGIDNDTISFRYADAEEETQQLTVSVREKGNASNVLGTDRSFTDPTNVSGTYSLTANQTEKTWVVSFDVERTDGEFLVSETVSNTPTLTPGFDEKWQLITGIGILLISAGLFSVINVGVGAVIIALEGGLLWYIGLLDGATSGAAVVIALFIAVLGHFMTSSRP